MKEWYDNENYVPDYDENKSFQYHYTEEHPVLGSDFWIIFSNGLPVGHTYYQSPEIKIIAIEQFYNERNGIWYVKGKDGRFIDGLENKRRYQEIRVSK